jgi:hypothetical protein
MKSPQEIWNEMVDEAIDHIYLKEHYSDDLEMAHKGSTRFGIMWAQEHAHEMPNVKILLEKIEHALNARDHNGDCIACTYSGSDEQEYVNHGCPKCVFEYIYEALAKFKESK